MINRVIHANISNKFDQINTQNFVQDNSMNINYMYDKYVNNFQGANIANMANAVKDNARQQANQHIYSEQKTSPAHVVAEILCLLKQLEETNPIATEAEQLAYVNIVAKPDLKKRAIAALKGGCETTIDEFVLNNKYLKVVKAVVMGWLQASD